MGQKVPRGRKKFCTECGTDLDDFWLSPGATDYGAVLKHHLECQRTGKFKGTMCSRLFIMDDGTPDGAKPKKMLSSRKLSKLKTSVLKRIEIEETGARKPEKPARP